ncbi:MAG: hypothetical protein J7M34_00370 [Anaerolineae bacterium]|nr:hypothetical protein [Anaerolineae bacterium]
MARVLREAGWDVVLDEGEIVASREDKGGAWTLAVDGAGRVLFTATQPARPARARRVRYSGLTYRTLWEEHGVFSVATDVQTPEELQRVLNHLPMLIRRNKLRRSHTR